MADTKISALPASTTPLVGTEILPIVQNGTTDKVSVANLTAGRAISATQYTSTIATGTAPLIVASTTEVANLKAATATLADSATSANAVKSNATTGVLQVTGPAAASIHVMTVPDADFTTARTDAGQTFTGNQQVNGSFGIGIAPSYKLDIGGTVSTGTSPTTVRFFQKSNWAQDEYEAMQLGLAQMRSIYNAGTWEIGFAPYTGSYNETIRLTYDGNIKPLVAGKGINFTANTPAAGMTSQLLNWYEEGDWTPTVTAGTGTITTVGTVSGKYTRIGRFISYYFSAIITTNGTGSNYVLVSGLPFTTSGLAGSGTEVVATGKMIQCFANNFTSVRLKFYDYTYPGADGATFNCIVNGYI